MRQLHHVNIVQLKHCFYCNGEKPDELYLNLVLEYIPDTVYGGKTTAEGQAVHARGAGEALHLPNLPLAGVHPFDGHLPSRY